MKNPRLFLPLVCALAIVAARAEESTTIKFSDPGKPGTLKIALARGDISIQGADTADVSVKSEMPPQQRPARKDGLRVLTESASYSLTEKDNVITLDALSDGWMGTPSDFRISVPRGTNIIVSNSLGGDVNCTGVKGDVEVKSLNGDVRLDDLVGSALVETTNGSIVAKIRELHDGKPLSFASTNGTVSLLVPDSAKANVRFRTQNGSILTDFDDKQLVTKVEALPRGSRSGKGTHTLSLSPEAKEAFREAARASAEAARRAAEAIREAAEAAREGAEGESERSHGDSHVTVPPVPPVPPVPAIPTITGGKLVTGALNGGGPEISVATMNGDVTLRILK
jgi:hypothetical protein